MDVTSKNFSESLKLVQTAINEATFLTIDAEFTGLNNGKPLNAFDTPEERYTKLREGSVDFLLIQFGLCAFKCIENKRYEYKAFNFFVFPKPFRRNYPDACFMCQSSCLDFLLSQKFDFNKLFQEGISYLSPVEEQKLKEQLEQKHYQQNHAMSVRLENPNADEITVRSPVPIPDQHKSFIEDVSKEIEEFVDGGDEILELQPCNPFLRKLIFQTVKQKHPTGLYLESKLTPKKECYIVITKANPDKLLEMEKAKKTLEMQEFDDAIGFTKIVKLISSSGKPVVGHNMLLDVLHLIHKFCCPLPADLEDFKAVTKCVFPRLLDTKLMASTYPFKDKISRTVLSDLLKILEKKPFSIPIVDAAEGFEKYSTRDEQLHKAGYDAYITGLCFLGMTKYIGKFNMSEKDSVSPNWDLLDPYINKLFLMKVQDIPYLNLAGDDLKPNRNHVFHVTFPKDWKVSDLMQLFEPFGHVFVAWVNDTSAFVALTQKDQADLVMRTLTQSDIYHVQAYAQYAMRKMKPNPYAAMLQDGARHGKKRPLAESVGRAKKARLGSSKNDSKENASHASLESVPEEDEVYEVSDSDSEPDSDNVHSEDGTEDIGVKVATPKTTTAKETNKGAKGMLRKPKKNRSSAAAGASSGEPVFEESSDWS